MRLQNTCFSTNKTLNLRGELRVLHRPWVMGIINVTPDSFYTGSRAAGVDRVLETAGQMLDEGADVLDIGGYSSRPGADAVTEEEERSRVAPAIRALHRAFPQAILSIDTFRAAIASEALQEGAAMVNDISAGTFDSAMAATVARHQAPLVAMHMRGTPQTMQQHTQYENLLHDLIGFFHRTVANLEQAGVKDIIVDPGFGFAKTADQNFELLGRLGLLHVLRRPLLVGLSRKSMIWRTLQTDPAGALNGTTALHMVALQQGAHILRVHDVRAAREAVTLFGQVQQATRTDKTRNFNA
jgi:dihydropteroate synthase